MSDSETDCECPPDELRCGHWCRGSRGRHGEVGKRGYDGKRGPQGEEGANSLKGFQSALGERGSQGEANPVDGPQGNDGDVGFQGEIGNQGTQGQTLVGPNGFQGNSPIPGSNIGPQGYQGQVGPQGDFFMSQVTGPQGDTGPQGQDSTNQGPQGDSGFQGNDGPQGNASALRGFQGSVTPNGSQGMQGDPPSIFGPEVGRGPQGIALLGFQGQMGFQGQSENIEGDRGYQGLEGIAITGPQGFDGPSLPPQDGFQGAQGTSNLITMGQEIAPEATFYTGLNGFQPLYQNFAQTIPYSITNVGPGDFVFFAGVYLVGSSGIFSNITVQMRRNGVFLSEGSIMEGTINRRNFMLFGLASGVLTSDVFTLHVANSLAGDVFVSPSFFHYFQVLN